MQLKKYVAVGLLAVGAAGAAFAGSADEGARGPGYRVKHHVIGGPDGGPISVEFAAMRNIMAELLSAKTGRTPAEIRTLFEKGGPREAFEQLGLSEDQVRPLFQEARTTFISRATAAGLITAEQAEKLKAAKVEMRHVRRPPDANDE